MQTLVIIEGKGAPEHLKLECLDSVVTIQEALRELEDAGEVKMQVSHHALSGEQLTQVKPLVFVLDEAKKSKRDKKNKHKDSKNRSKSGVSVKNFGAKLSIPAFKGATALTCAWRCRIDSNAEGSKSIMPVRPVSVLTGNLDAADGEVLQLF
ncbi:unnamed protein product [Effrenium voratum]|nr:unnamed protein product [Effrenium voratum]